MKVIYTHCTVKFRNIMSDKMIYIQQLWCLGRQMHASGLPGSSRKSARRRYKMWIVEIWRAELTVPLHSTLTQKRIKILHGHIPYKRQHSSCFCYTKCWETCSLKWSQKKQCFPSFSSFFSSPIFLNFIFKFQNCFFFIHQPVASFP